MGYAFENRDVRGSDGWPLSGATNGSAAQLEMAIDALRDWPEDAVQLCGKALHLAPSFLMGHIVMAHGLMAREAMIGRAAGLLLAWHTATARERSHLDILSGAGARGVDRDRLLYHLRCWPGDRLALCLSGERVTRPDGERPARLCAR